MSVRSQQLDDVIAAIDVANAEDPNTVVVDGVTRPKEQAHAELMTVWVQRLDPDADEAQLIAARAHHLRRWTCPRDAYPVGRKGYLRWRADAKREHADEVAGILRSHAVDDTTIDRVQRIIRKEGLQTDAAVQTHEDALCLVFLQTQLTSTAAKMSDERAMEVLCKTLGKMSTRGRELARSLSVAPAEHDLIVAALEEVGD
jgi:hypothetical protein